LLYYSYLQFPWFRDRSRFRICIAFIIQSLFIIIPYALPHKSRPRHIPIPLRACLECFYNMRRERKNYSSGGNMVTVGCGMKLAWVKCKDTVWGMPKNDAQLVINIVTPRMLPSGPLVSAA